MNTIIWWGVTPKIYHNKSNKGRNKKNIHIIATNYNHIHVGSKIDSSNNRGRYNFNAEVG